jgi:hypothetical protein
MGGRGGSSKLLEKVTTVLRIAQLGIIFKNFFIKAAENGVSNG